MWGRIRALAMGSRHVHNHWVECITSSYYGQLHGHSEREIMLASAEPREQNRESHVRTPIDAKRLADFLAKIEAYEAVLLQRQRDIENQIVVYHIEQKSAEVANTPQPVLQEMLNSHRANDATLSRFAPIDLTTKSRTNPCPSGAVCAARCQMGADACGCQKWGSRIPVC